MICAPPIFDFSDITKGLLRHIPIEFEQFFPWYSKFDSFSTSAPSTSSCTSSTPTGSSAGSSHASPRTSHEPSLSSAWSNHVRHGPNSQPETSSSQHCRMAEWRTEDGSCSSQGQTVDWDEDSERCEEGQACPQPGDPARIPAEESCRGQGSFSAKILIRNHI